MKPSNKTNKIHFIWNSEISMRTIIPEISNYIKRVHVCSLCNIAYSGLRKKPEWKEFTKQLQHQGIETQTHYKNMISKEMKDLAKGTYPIVITEENGKLKVLLTKEDIDDCHGDINKFEMLLTSSLSS